jgi:transcriptional regulator
MYNPAHFNETRRAVIEAAMAQHPLATLVTGGPEGLAASHIPLLYYPSEDGFGILRGHLARANPQWRNHGQPCEALAIFSGPDHYVSPTWYPSKKEHGKVVPTWNYVIVHAHGSLSFKDDSEWLLENVRALSDTHEKSNETRWQVADAPPEYIESLLKAIIGVELIVTKLEGKWKVSQNRPDADREGVVAGLEGLDSSEARVMAKLVKEKLRG